MACRAGVVNGLTAYFCLTFVNNAKFCIELLLQKPGHLGAGVAGVFLWVFDTPEGVGQHPRGPMPGRLPTPGPGAGQAGGPFCDAGWVVSDNGAGQLGGQRCRAGHLDRRRGSDTDDP